MYLDTVGPFAVAKVTDLFILHSTTPRARLLVFLRTVSSSLNTLRFFSFPVSFHCWLINSRVLTPIPLGEWGRKAGVGGFVTQSVRCVSLQRLRFVHPVVFICVEEGDGYRGCHGRPHYGLFLALSYRALTESQSNTSLASCFLCFWIFGNLQPAKKNTPNTPCGTSSRIFSLTFESVIFIYKCFFFSY